MRKTIFLAVFVLAMVLVGCDHKRKGTPKVLVFAKTMGYTHASIPTGMEAIQKLGRENGFEVDTTKVAGIFTDEGLSPYSAVVFLNTTGNVLDHQQEAAFERYIQAGGGFVGVHSATDTEYDWGWYGKLVGAYFNGHPPGTPKADFIIKDPGFVATQHFTDSVWKRTDELYNYKKINPDLNILMTVDEATYEGGTNGDFHPMAWYHSYDGGRAFYTGGGHTHESYSEEPFLKHLLGGIQYAIGDNMKLDYEKAVTQIPPDLDRFSKVSLTSGQFFEPTEMAILPNNDVLIGQRRGEVMLFDASTNELKEVAKLDVYYKTLHTPRVNAEEGLMGLQKDPDYANNQWIYIYYAPTGEEWVNRLSRFKFQDGKFDLSSEQKILDVESQREICCHTGGSIAFDKNGLLYLSTGDNSTPFNERGAKYVLNGFGPINDLPGKEQYDARRSSANTNDLRGKIIRIKVNADGSYDIPKGNLFPEGTSKTRPEIYTMGHRNPYRISVDQKNGYVYWGDVGPDARNDDPARGSRGYDEMNQAREAGNFGWPLFVGGNKAYVDFDFETGKSGKTFDPNRPINDSRNNTGLRELPPAKPAYVFYPYAPTGDFPQVGTGGRNAMAGPVYYSDLYPDGGGLPQYYDGRVLIYDWIRGWMKAATFFEDGTFNKMEPFASDIEVNNLIDMEMGPDGRVYLLEYGSGWFSQNVDSGLSYIQFNPGNRPPKITALTVDHNSGTLPLEVKAKVDASDPENDALGYTWDFGNGQTLKTQVPEVAYTYSKNGNYRLSVVVNDDKGEIAKSGYTSIVAGNTRPMVDITILGDPTDSFKEGEPIAYKVIAQDADGSPIDNSNFFISVDYLESLDAVNQSLGHQQVEASVTGKALTLSMDCKTCHKEAEASIGPNYTAVAEKYVKQRRSKAYLQRKIITGGGGVWGEVVMPAHPNVTPDESRQIVEYILSLAHTENEKKSLPVKGTLVPRPVQGTQAMVLKASYTDNGSGNAMPLTGSTSVVLRKTGENASSK
ncbi:MAG: ThuA domain-containing protein [Bacteroidota bacterium]